jgi:hypothetical protein
MGNERLAKLNALVEVERLSRGQKINVARAKAATVSVIVPRDPRAMNHMDPTTRVVHAMLEQWGRETRNEAENGYPSTTLLGRVIEQGPGAGQAGRPVSHLSEQSARVDVQVARLRERPRECVKMYYQRWEPMEVMARKLTVQLGYQMSVSTLKDTLRRTRELLAYWLEV